MTKAPKQIAAYHHRNIETTQEPDPQPGNYYCSVFDPSDNAGHGRLGLILGPFARHADALANLDAARNKASEVCRDAIWYSFGTVRCKDDCTQPGTLNRFFPELF